VSQLITHSLRDDGTQCVVGDVSEKCTRRLENAPTHTHTRTLNNDYRMENRLYIFYLMIPPNDCHII